MKSKGNLESNKCEYGLRTKDEYTLTRIILYHK